MNEAQLQTSTTVLQTAYTQRGLTFTRRFSTEGVSPYDELKWERRTASITDARATPSLSRRTWKCRWTGR